VTAQGTVYTYDVHEETTWTLDELKHALTMNPRVYLAHTDACIRSEADWAMEYYKIRNLRPQVKEDRELGHWSLQCLLRRLQALSVEQQHE
jgi:hypothetical protein